MNYGEFKVMVAGYMNRDAEAFVFGTADLLTNACNAARKWAERQYDFEFNRVPVKIPSVSLVDGALLSTAVDPTDSEVSILVKKIERAFLPFSGASGTFPVEFVHRDSHMRRMRAQFARVVSTNFQSIDPRSQVGYFSVMQQGERIYVTPSAPAAFNGSSVTDVYLDVVKWMADYVDTDVDDEDNDDEEDGINSFATDFFLTHHHEFLMFRAITQLNFFLKEDQRVAIAGSALQATWETVKTWDTSLIDASAEDVNLD